MAQRLFRPLQAKARESQLAVIRRLMSYAEMLAESLRLAGITMEREYIYDAIDDGARLLKQLGGSALR
jgi:hypothetical protein